MAKAKFKEYFDQMCEQEAELFTQFESVHQAYCQQPTLYQAEFNQVGERVVDRVRDWERRLCAAMGRTMYGKYAEQLSEKFWGLVREKFGQIDMVGVKIE
jgi:hypothetical protein